MAGVGLGRSRDRCETAVAEGSDGEAEEAVVDIVFFFNLKNFLKVTFHL